MANENEELLAVLQASATRAALQVLTPPLATTHALPPRLLTE